MTEEQAVDVVVVGAGFAGMYMLHRLRRSGMRAVVLEAFRASVGHDVSEYAAHITAPVLLIAADRDDITPLSAQHRLDTLFPDSRLYVVEGVGHLVHYEAPDLAADEVRAFVADHPEDGPASSGEPA